MKTEPIPVNLSSKDDFPIYAYKKIDGIMYTKSSSLIRKNIIYIYVFFLIRGKEDLISIKYTYIHLVMFMMLIHLTICCTSVTIVYVWPKFGF